MSSPAIVTMTKIMETLPEAVQNQALAHLRDYIAEIQAEKNGMNCLTRRRIS